MVNCSPPERDLGVQVPLLPPMNSNSELVQKLISEKTLKTPLIISVFNKIDRRDFVLPEDQYRAYDDNSLPLGYGATISQPTTVAIMLEKLFEGDPSTSLGASKILEIGTGCGYLTALLVQIVGSRGEVFSIEYVFELKELAEKNLESYDFKNINLFVGDGKFGLPDKAPFDKIISSAAAQEVPKAWKEQLKTGGRILSPVGSDLVILKKLTKGKFKEEKIYGFLFVPLQ